MTASTYQPIVTRAGRSADQAAKVAGGAKVVFTGILIGDGGGAAVAPDDTWTALARQVCVLPVDRVYLDDADPNVVWIEGALGPASPHGFMIRELGLQLADGTLYAVGAVPDTYIPLPAQGAARDAHFRIPIVETSGGTVLLIDNPGQWATEAWVTDNVSPSLAELLRAAALARADLQRMGRRLDEHAHRLGRLERGVGWLRAIADQLRGFLPGLNTTPTPHP